MDLDDFYTVPEVADILSLGITRVRRLIEEKTLGAIYIDGVLRIPKSFIKDEAPFGALKGTLILLEDAGFKPGEAAEWMITEEPSLGAKPIDALLAGRKAEVRRVAQALL